MMNSSCNRPVRKFLTDYVKDADSSVKKEVLKKAIWTSFNSAKTNGSRKDKRASNRVSQLRGRKIIKSKERLEMVKKLKIEVQEKKEIDKCLWKCGPYEQ